MSVAENRATKAINRDSTITFGSAVAVITAIVLAYGRLVALEHQVAALTAAVEKTAEDRWTQTEMHYYSLLLEQGLREYHPGIVLPEVPLLSE